MQPVLQYVVAVTVPVPDLDRGMAFYRGVLGHQLIWRNEATGQAGLRTPRSDTEIVLTARQASTESQRAGIEAGREVGGEVLPGLRPSGAGDPLSIFQVRSIGTYGHPRSSSWWLAIRPEPPSVSWQLGLKHLERESVPRRYRPLPPA